MVYDCLSNKLQHWFVQTVSKYLSQQLNSFLQVHSHGAILIVDGAQAHGGVDVDVKALGVDAYDTICVINILYKLINIIHFA